MHDFIGDIKITKKNYKFTVNIIDAVPSIFPWNMADNNSITKEKIEIGDENNEKANGEEDFPEILNSSKESEPENLDAIKKFIEDQEKEQIQEKDAPKSVESQGACIDNNDASDENSTVQAEATHNDIITNKEQDALLFKENELETENINEEKELQEETMAVASSVMDMILSDSVAQIAKKKVKPLSKDCINAEEKGWYIIGSYVV